MQDAWQTATAQGSAALPLFFWPGQDSVARAVQVALEGPAPRLYEGAEVSRMLEQGRTVLVLWRGPDHDLASSLASGAPAAKALRAWKEQARGLTRLYRQNRRTLILAEASGLGRGGWTALAGRLGRPATALDLEGGAPSALALALTRLALAEDPELGQVVEELTASSLPAAEVDAGAVIEQVISEAAAAATRAADPLPALAAAAEVEALARTRQMLDEAQAAREAAEADRARLLAEAEDLTQRAARDAADLSTLQEAMSAAEARIAALQGRLARQEDLSRDIAESQALFAEDYARLTASNADAGQLAVRLAAREQEISLLRTLSEPETDGLPTLADAMADVSARRVALLNGTLQSLEAALAKSRAEQTLFREDVARLRQTIEEDARKLAASGAEKAKLSADLTARLEAAQDTARRSTAVVEEFHKLLRGSGDPALPATPGTPAWDRAVAANLATLRRMAEHHQRAERELSTLRRSYEALSRRDVDVTVNARLFAQMTEETTAALDSIARLSAASAAAPKA